MAGPWEAFANQPVQEAQGPWTAFASPVETSPGKEAPTRVTMDMSKVPVQQTTSPAARLTLDFLNQGSAAGQRTTPNIAAQMKNFISDDVHENDAGEVLYRDPQSGKLVPTDQNKQVALRDPTDGKIKVFARTPDTDEGVFSSLGRLVMTGSGAGAPTARAALPPSAAAAPVTEGQEIANAATRLSASGAPVTVPRAVATDSMATQRAAATARNIPLAGDPLVKASERTLTQLGDKASEVAQGFGDATSVAGAGDVASGAIRSWIKGDSARRSSQLYDKVDNLVDAEAKAPLVNARGVAAEIEAERMAAHLPNGKAVDTILDAVNSADGLTYQGVKTLRTKIGEAMNSGILPEGMSGSDLKRIYAALTDDLRSSVLVGGGEKAVEAFDRANRYHRLISDRREALAKIVGAGGDAPAEKVFDRLVAMAGSNSRGDVSKLSQARKAIGADDWNEFTSGVVSRLGRDAEGNFSPLRFLTDYGKLTPSGKSILFRSAGKSELANHLDDIAKISSRYKSLQKFANPSGTAQGVFGGGIGAGLFADPLTTAAAVLGGRTMAYALSRPATAASVAKLARSQEALVRNPTTPRLVAFNLAARNLVNTLGDYGRSINPSDFMRALQGGVPSRANDEQQKPEGVINR